MKLELRIEDDDDEDGTSFSGILAVMATALFFGGTAGAIVINSNINKITRGATEYDDTRIASTDASYFSSFCFARTHTATTTRYNYMLRAYLQMAVFDPRSSLDLLLLFLPVGKPTV